MRELIILFIVYSCAININAQYYDNYNVNPYQSPAATLSMYNDMLYETGMRMGRNSFQMGDFSGAAGSFEAALMGKKTAEAYNMLGCARYRTGQYEFAYESFTKALELSPNDEVIKKNKEDALQEYEKEKIAKSKNKSTQSTGTSVPLSSYYIPSQSNNSNDSYTPNKRVCGYCNGTGECPFCNSMGQAKACVDNPYGVKCTDTYCIGRNHRCHYCGGTHRCSNCNGKGFK